MFITTRTCGKPDTTDIIGTTSTKSSLKECEFSLQPAKFPETYPSPFCKQSAAWQTPFHDFRKNLRPIALLGVGLVLVTTLVVGWVAHSIFPGLPWAAAFALGAIISPPDAIAASAVTQRLRIPRRIVVILEGESLLNDASGLVAYRVALAVAAGQHFSFSSAVSQVRDRGGGRCCHRFQRWGCCHRYS